MSGYGKKKFRERLNLGGNRFQVMVRKEFFMKFNISRDKHGMGLEIEKLVALLSERVTQEDTWGSSGLEFVSMSFEGGGKT